MFLLVNRIDVCGTCSNMGRYPKTLLLDALTKKIEKKKGSPAFQGLSDMHVTLLFDQSNVYAIISSSLFHGMTTFLMEWNWCNNYTLKCQKWCCLLSCLLSVAYYTPSLLCIIGLALMYLQNNPGGITIFGWTVDRGLINTIFFIELTVVTFILGKTIAFTGQ